MIQNTLLTLGILIFAHVIIALCFVRTILILAVRILLVLVFLVVISHYNSPSLVGLYNTNESVLKNVTKIKYFFAIDEKGPRKRGLLK